MMLLISLLVKNGVGIKPKPRPRSSSMFVGVAVLDSQKLWKHFGWPAKVITAGYVTQVKVSVVLGA